MKQIKYIRALLVFCMFLITGSCSKQLDIVPQSQVTSSNFYKSTDDINQAVVGCYNALAANGEYGENFLFFMEVAADNAKTANLTNSGGIYGDFDVFRVAADNPVLDQTWSACYTGIQRCNILLNRIGNISMPDSLKAIRIGEAKFIRALTYFNMVRIWGAVPLVTKEVTDPFTEFDHGRDDTSLVYKQIITDLSEAALALPLKQTGSNIGRATQGAAKTLLGKVYLTQHNFIQASQVLKAVVDSGTYQLLPNFANIFGSGNKNNNESIFEIQYSNSVVSLGSGFSNYFAIDASNIGGIGQVLAYDIPTNAFIDSFSVNDLRRNGTLNKLNKKYYCKKFVDPAPVQNLDGNTNFMVLRYADVLLMLAEAINEMGFTANGDAFNYINQVRQRAGLANITSSNTPDQPSFRLAIEKERKYELAFENHRWFDLVRTGRAIDVMNTAPTENGIININKNNFLFYIPQSQIDVKPGLLTQNP